MRAKVKVILPRKSQVVDVAAFEAGVERLLDEGEREMLDLSEKTVSTWNTQVRFNVRRGKHSRSVGTRSTIYKFVNEGTRAHPITPRGPWPMRFPTGGRPKSRPNYIASYQGAPGNKWVSARKVAHPGTEPRNFTKQIQKRVGDKFAKGMRRLMREVTIK